MTYKTAKAQYEARLKEAQEGNKLKAREYLLGYYKEMLVRVGESANSLMAALSYELGAAEVGGKVDPVGLANMHITQVAGDIDSVLTDMQNEGLSESSEFKELKKYQEQALDLKPSDDPLETQSNMHILLKIYYFVAKCAQKVLETKTESLFLPYVKTE